jgi:CBS domain-containing protein
VDLLRYDEDTAGGLMGKELVKVNENWNVLTCVKEMRIQAEHVTRVHSIYVVDDENRLKGRLSLKDLLTTSTKTPISQVYIKKVDYVKVDTPNTEVARVMQKYDLEAIPVVDELGRLVGRVTIDDIVDVIKEEADKDYQMAAGITQDVEASDSVFELTKARLPWLLIGMVVKLLHILKGNEKAFHKFETLIIFVPFFCNRRKYWCSSISYCGSRFSKWYTEGIQPKLSYKRTFCGNDFWNYYFSDAFSISFCSLSAVSGWYGHFNLNYCCYSFCGNYWNTCSVISS